MRYFMMMLSLCIPFLLSAEAACMENNKGDTLSPTDMPQKTFHTTSASQGIGWWMLDIYTDITNHDSIWVKSNIRMSAGTDQTPFFLTSQSPPTLIIWRADQPGKQQIKTLSAPLIFHEYTLHRRTSNSHLICSFRLDIRNVFGKLSPGKYFLKMEWPIEGRFMHGTKKAVKTTLQSPKANFTIHNVSSADLKKIVSQQEKKKETIKHLTCKLLQPPGSGIEVTNRSKKPIYFRYEQIRRKPGSIDILAAHLDCYAWHPKSGWQYLAQYTKHKFTTYTLSPGKSVQLRPTRSCYYGDGIYYYAYKTVEKINRNPYVSTIDFGTSAFIMQGSTGFSAEKKKNIKEDKKK